MVDSLSLCKLLNESICGAAKSSVCTYGCIREIFESRYLRDVADECGGGGAAATASVHSKSTELKLEKNKNNLLLIYSDKWVEIQLFLGNGEFSGKTTNDMCSQANESNNNQRFKWFFSHSTDHL